MAFWTKEDTARLDRERKANAAKMRAICAEFDVEYLGLSGFAGPRFAEAEAAWAAYYAGVRAGWTSR